MILDHEYWRKYYLFSDVVPQNPSDFALWVETQLPDKNVSILDMGCGNGRDLKYFVSKGFKVMGVDSVAQPGLKFFCHTDVIRFQMKADIIYCRWLLHALDERSENIFLSNCLSSLNPNGKLFIECRSNKDDIKPVLEGHFRRPIDEKELETELLKLGYKIEYMESSRGWSKVGDDDPLLIRVVARK